MRKEEKCFPVQKNINQFQVSPGTQGSAEGGGHYKTKLDQLSSITNEDIGEGCQPMLQCDRRKGQASRAAGRREQDTWAWEISS